MATPREIVERIRRREYLIGVELPEEAAEGAQNMRVNLNNALKALSEDLYAKDTHFVLELVQNADDNKYAPGVLPEISFHLTATCLRVQNNEVGFSEANVRALCKVGQSTKTKHEGFIGEKGIGFKSVFTVTDKPEIHSNGFHFRFDIADSANMLGYVVPNWCDAAESEPPQTSIVLPAKDGKRFTSETLVELGEELLLFLRRLRRLSIDDTIAAATSVYNRADEDGLVTLTAECTRQGKAEGARIRKFRYVRHTYGTKNIAEVKRAGITDAAVVLAFPLKEDGTASADVTHSVFAFLPIRDFGFRFLVQADFLLSANREDIHRSPAWNKRARDEITHAFVSATELFKADPTLCRSFLQFVPRKGDVTDPFFAEVADKIVEELKNLECILTTSGAWRKPQEVISADDDLKELFPNDELKRLLGLEYLSDQVEGPQVTMERLGVSSATVHAHLLPLLQKDDRLATRSTAWLRRLYRYCEKRLTRDADIKKFRGLAAIKLDGGALAKLSDRTIYFPLQRGRRFGFEHELAILDPELTVRGEGSDEVLTFLLRVGVKRTEPYSLIVHHILPKHAGEDWKHSDFGALVGHIRYLKEYLSEYLKGCAGIGTSADVALEGLRSGVYLQTKRVEEKLTYFSRPSALYVSDDYKPSVLLERLLRADAKPGNLVAAVYMQKMQGESDADNSANKRQWKVDQYDRCQ